MKRSTLIVSLALMLALAVGLVGTTHAFTSPAQGNEKVRVLVQFEPNGKGNVEKALQNSGAEFHYEFDDLNTFAVTLPSAALDGISHNPNVAFVEEDVLRFPVSIMKSNVVAATAAQSVPYGVDMVRARDVWDADRNGVVDAGAPTASNRKICIIDSGIYTAHEDLQ